MCDRLTAAENFACPAQSATSKTSARPRHLGLFRRVGINSGVHLNHIAGRPKPLDDTSDNLSSIRRTSCGSLNVKLSWMGAAGEVLKLISPKTLSCLFVFSFDLHRVRKTTHPLVSGLRLTLECCRSSRFSIAPLLIGVFSFRLQSSLPCLSPPVNKLYKPKHRSLAQ